MPRRSVVDPRFPERLRELRLARGLSLRDLSRAAYVGKSTISELEAARKTPGVDTARALDKALRAGGELARMVVEADGTPDGDNDQRLAYVVEHPRRLDRATIDTLAVLLAGQRNLEDTVGSVPMLPVADAQLSVVAGLVTEARGDLRSAMVGIGAQWAQFAGWLHLSAEQPDRAAVLFDRALEWAVETGDREMIATVLSFKGHAAWLAGQVGPLIGLTEAALRDQGVFVGQRAYDVHQLARGHALAGDRRAAVNTLAAGVDLSAEAVASTGERPAWHYYRNEAFFSLEAGIVHRLLGRDEPGHNTTAVRLLTTGLAGLPAEMRGADWAAEYAYHLAVAQVQAGDFASAETGLRVLRSIAAATRSTRLRAHIRALSAALTRDC
jgi:transcriptional regulator with XRE-family HTH domain